MMDLAETLLSEVDARREELIALLQGFVRTPTPNPPGHTREGAAYLEDVLSARGLSCRVIAPIADMPNLLAAFDTGRAGPHLAPR